MVKWIKELYHIPNIWKITLEGCLSNFKKYKLQQQQQQIHVTQIQNIRTKIYLHLNIWTILSKIRSIHAILFTILTLSGVYFIAAKIYFFKKKPATKTKIKQTRYTYRNQKKITLGKMEVRAAFNLILFYCFQLCYGRVIFCSILIVHSFEHEKKI